MKRRFARAQALAAAATLLGLAGAAQAGPVLTTSPVELDFYGYTMACNVVNAGATTVQVATKFCDFNGSVVSATPALALSPGEGTSHSAPAGKGVYYCKFVVKSGLPSDVRAAAVVSRNGHYQTTSEAR